MGRMPVAYPAWVRRFLCPSFTEYRHNPPESVLITRVRTICLYPEVIKMTPAFHTHLNRACQICALFIISAVGVADLKTSAPHASSQTAPPAKNKPSTKAELRRQKALTMEMIDPYAAWLWFEVGDIATREEVSV